jgi:hypothetical protein
MRKARKPSLQEQLNWAERMAAEILSDAVLDHEIEREFFGELAGKLIAGIRGDNVTFSPGELEVLLRLVRKHKLAVDHSEIALYSRRLELDGRRTKVAIDETAQKFNVGRSTVFAARKRYLEHKARAKLR